jgi:glycyl-tRNA synthetase beta chain
MAEFLLELFSEEIPARMQARAAEDLQRLVTDKLKAAGLAFTSAKSFVTPRRLALVIDGLPLAQPDVKEEKKGPRVGSPQQAVDGFLKSAGLTSLDQAEKRDTGKGEFYFAVVERQGRNTCAVLVDVVQSTLGELPWPKSMRWANGDLRWVRPLRSIVALFGGSTLPLYVETVGSIAYSIGEDEPSAEYIKKFGVIVGADKTRGHRFLSSDEITVASFADYQAKLRDAKVILDQAERRASIKTQAEKLAAAEGLTVKPDEGLLDEVTGLVEWPVVLMGRIDDEFMSVPHEVLTTSMRVNQKYFALLDRDGNLAPRFLVTANIEASDGGKAIIHGNERVLRARLSDAKFFWDQDLKVGLSARVPLLDPITYHAKLGSVGDKGRRIKALAREIAKYVPGCEAGLANQAAGLAKADLVSGMVGEFPELQGIMGRYYARAEKLPDEVADAIADHYKPLGPNDSCPRAPVSVVVALADKIDTLTGFFAIDEKPTGSKDPFALRRAALGIIRLILENRLRLPLRGILATAYRGYQGIAGFGDNVPREVQAALMDFFADRLKVALKEQGARHDLVAAVFALGDEDDLTRLLARVEALKGLIDSADGANLLAGYKRAANILRIEEKKDGLAYGEAPDTAWLKQGEEQALYDALRAVEGTVAKAIAGEDFAAAMVALAALRGPVDAFFDKVTVNADEKELRANRLRLLNAIRLGFNRVADFSRIEG